MPNGKNTGSDTGAEQHRDLKKVINEFKVLHLRHLPASVVHISDADGIRNFTRCEWGCLTKSSPLKRKGPALAQEPGCGAIGCYSAGGVHRSLLPPEEPPLLPPLSGAGVTTSGVWRRVAEAA